MVGEIPHSSAEMMDGVCRHYLSFSLGPQFSLCRPPLQAQLILGRHLCGIEHNDDTADGVLPTIRVWHIAEDGLGSVPARQQGWRLRRTPCTNRWRAESLEWRRRRARCWLRIMRSAAPAGGSLNATSSDDATSRCEGWIESVLKALSRLLCVLLGAHDPTSAVLTTNPTWIHFCGHQAC